MTVEVVVQQEERVIEILVQHGGDVDLSGVMARLAALESKSALMPDLQQLEVGDLLQVIDDDGTHKLGPA